MPSFMPSRGVLTVIGFAAEQDRPGGRRLYAKQGKSDFRAPGADQSREAQHFAAMKFETDAFKGPAAAKIDNGQKEILPLGGRARLQRAQVRARPCR